ncbi:quinoprotein glucose dehydrogenase [Siminovitchia acidinfaciens]|uniref:Quinoprotein glucose dehydrogenase n=1 Tax=Siminovitchia acidinfaciens TaxID=2321395 RepID=A0A429Y4J8_9BACI|nr:PQQ-dependent sugar dehydrogenase [Siminovitchia acidinfaciens]RST76308.1 quinoprotein glucose dehydrogenase [Siminovitchia acidinfaciens]
MKKVLLIFIILLLSSCSQSKQQEPQDKEEDHPTSGRVTDVRLAERLQTPWSITKKGSKFYISERNGTIALVDIKSGKVKREQVALNKPLHTEGEGGLLGLELLSDTNVEALAYHTYLENGEVLNRLVHLNKEQDQWSETAVLLEGIPGAGIHNGGRVKIGPDHMIYVTTGDAANPDLSQDRNSLAGKILRMELDGSVPEDNPFADSPVYSYGHRNPQGLAWDDTGQLYATEHGQSAHDEINKIEPGKNYGWPVIQGDEKRDGMETPLYHTNGNTWAPSGTAFYNGSLYISTLRGEAVRIFEIENKVADIFEQGTGRVRDVLIEKGTLYYITNNTDGRGVPASYDDQLIGISLE